MVKIMLLIPGFFLKDLNPLNPKVSYQFGEFGIGSTNNPLIDVEEM